MTMIMTNGEDENDNCEDDEAKETNDSIDVK